MWDIINICENIDKRGNKMQFDFSDWFDLEQKEVAGFRLIDLSDPIEEQTVVPGEKGYSDPDVVFATKPWVTLDIKPYYITKIVMGAHVGTHIDAPMHASEGGKSVDEIPNVFIGPALIIEADEKLNDVVLQRVLNRAKNDSIIVIRGKSNYKIPNDYRMQIIRSRPRVVIFADCVNVDGVEDTIQYLTNDIPMIMGANQKAVEQLKDGDIIFALPLKFKGIEAAPVRLFALKFSLDEKDTNGDISDFLMED